MANDWSANLDDPEATRGLPALATLMDPDEAVASLNARDGGAGAPQTGGAGSDGVGPGMRNAPVSAAMTAPAGEADTPVPGAQQGSGGPPVPPSASGMPSTLPDVTMRALQGGFTSGQKQLDDADKMTVDPSIAARRTQMEQDAAGAPKASDYKPGFGTRVLRGLEGFATGLGNGKGALPGLLNPASVGAKAYGAPTDAYDTALAANQKKVASDTQGYNDALSDFKMAQDTLKERQGALKGGGEAMGKVATEANAASEIPIKQQQADTAQAGEVNRAMDAKNNSPAGVAAVQDAQLTQRGKDADRLFGPGKGGQMRTYYMANGKMPTPNEMSRGGAAAAGPTVPNAAPGVSGEDYLKTLDPGLAGTVRAIGEGREAPPGAANRSKQAQALLSAVNQAYPGYDATAYPTYASTRKAFTSGPVGTAINSFNTSLNHLDRLESNIPNNTGSSTVNWLETALSPSGSQRTQSMAKFDDDATAVSGEVAKAYKGGAITEGERDHMLTLLNRNDAPATMKAHIQEFRELLQGKLDSYQRQWESGMPPGAVSPVQTLRGGGRGAGGNAGSGAAANPGAGSSGGGSNWFTQHPVAQ